MKLMVVTALTASGLALTGCGQKTADTNAAMDTNVATADTNGSAGNGAMAAPAASGGQAFANAAAASDAFEIATSKLALTSASSSAVKTFAQKMIDAHTDSTAKLKAATAEASPAITPSPSLTADQQAKLDALKALSGKAFDQAYVDAQVAGHQQTLDTIRSYAATGDVPQLRSFATTLSPIVAAHLNMAKAIKGKSS